MVSAQKYKWTIPRLSELYPKGEVGKDVCLMGLNKNKGEEILLRLRTDDMLGFRKYLRAQAWWQLLRCTSEAWLAWLLQHQGGTLARTCAQSLQRA